MSGMRRRLDPVRQRRNIRQRAITASIMQTGRLQVGRGLQFERYVELSIAGVSAWFYATYGGGKRPGQQHLAAMPSRKALARVRRMIPK